MCHVPVRERGGDAWESWRLQQLSPHPAANWDGDYRPGVQGTSERVFCEALDNMRSPQRQPPKLMSKTLQGVQQDDRRTLQTGLVLQRGMVRPEAPLVWRRMFAWGCGGGRRDTHLCRACRRQPLPPTD